jgi:hypothetical protein
LISRRRGMLHFEPTARFVHPMPYVHVKSRLRWGSVVLASILLASSVTLVIYLTAMA